MKYHNTKLNTPDGKFDSKREYNRWCELKLMERAGRITSLERQVKILLIPTQYIGTGRNKRMAERELSYVADFVYTDVDSGKQVVEDAKGVRTKEYIIKRKLALYLKGIRIKEV